MRASDAGPGPAEVRLRCLDGKETRGAVELRALSARERAVRAWKLVGLLWGLALAAVLIPIAHFILVPGLFLAGCIAGPRAYRTQEVLVAGNGACPHCGAALSFRPGPAQWPGQETCGACQWAVTVERT